MPDEVENTEENPAINNQEQERAFVKVEGGVVVQKQPNEEEGFIEAPLEVICGYLYDDQTEEFTAPEAVGPDPNEEILQQIRQLESTITTRRLIEGFLGEDNGWLSAINGQISSLRGQLTD